MRLRLLQSKEEPDDNHNDYNDNGKSMSGFAVESHRNYGVAACRFDCFRQNLAIILYMYLHPELNRAMLLALQHTLNKMPKPRTILTEVSHILQRSEILDKMKPGMLVSDLYASLEDVEVGYDTIMTEIGADVHRTLTLQDIIMIRKRFRCHLPLVHQTYAFDIAICLDTSLIYLQLLLEKNAITQDTRWHLKIDFTVSMFCSSPS